MIPYWKAKEAWIRRALLDDPESLPDDFLDDLQRMIADVETRILEVEGKEPLRSLLVGEREHLQAFHDQISQVLQTRPSIATSPPTATRPVAAAQKADPGSEERFYRISRKPEVEASQVEARPIPATLDLTGEGTEEPETAATPEPRRIADATPHERNRVIKIRRDLPCFVGPDMKTYGPFVKEDIVALADEVSSILLEGKVGEVIRPAGEET